jgi:hypothetical protein
VLRAIEKRLVVTAAMAAEAASRVIRRFALEAIDQFTGGGCFLRVAGRCHHPICMRFAWAMAGLTVSSKLRRGWSCLRMYGFCELLRFVLMARRADLHAHVIIW